MRSNTCKDEINLIQRVKLMRRSSGAAVLVLALAGPLAHTDAVAQTTFIGGSGQTGVVVNLQAIHGNAGGLALGTIPRTGGLLIPNLDPPPGNSRLVLRAPRMKRAAPSTKAAAPQPPMPKKKMVKVAPPAPKPPAMPVPKVTAKPVPAPMAKVTPPAPAPIKRTARAAAPPPPPSPKTTAAPAAPRISAPPPAKQPATAPAAAKPPRKMAALPAAGDSIMQLQFRAGSSAISTDDEARLSGLSKRLVDTSARLQLKAFADAANGDSSSTRRLSLSRALAVRAYLIENGMRSTRIDVRALGTARDGGPADRVDVILLER